MRDLCLQALPVGVVDRISDQDPPQQPPNGEQGQGLGAGNPPLAGQPATYLAEQLRLWRIAKRRNDPGDVMLRISQLLTPEEAAALSAYSAALPGGDRPSQALQEASLEARRVDPRNDASAPPLHVPESARAKE